MRFMQLFNPTSLVLLVLGAAAIFSPIGGPVGWSMFGAVLLTTSLIAYTRFSPGRACMTLGGLLAMGSLAAANAGNAVMETLVLGIAGGALVVGAIVTLFLKTKTMVQHDFMTRASFPLKIRPSLPTTGEVMASRQQAKKSNLPAPKFIEPTWEKDFRQIVGMDEFKKKLREAGLESVGVKDRNGILLHGEPGNGKTVFAKALAGELGLEFISIHKLASKWVGEETDNLFKQLNEAASRAPCLVFIDEADSVLGVRGDSSHGGSMPETNAIVNRLLTFLVDYRQSGLVFVAATNFLDMIDPAIRRPGRFDFVFEVPNPDLPARAGLLRKGIATHAQQVTIEQGVIESLAKRWNGFNTATILAVPAQIPQYLKDTKKDVLDFDDFMAMLRNQQGISNRVPEDTKSFASMSYPDGQGQAIKNLISRMERSFQIEEAGGAAPSGVLFYGDPGTGKTETARMISKETKWAFFPVSGSDLARDPDLIEKVLKKVRNARPAIVFIDEADDLLGDRGNSPYKAATNKLLEAMDGSLGRMNDLLWVASTNFVEASDAAVIRSGRFTEKIKFNKPGDQSLLAFAKAFFADPKRNAVMQVSWEDVGRVLEGCSIADAQGILMQAWNLTLTTNGGVDRSIPVTLEALESARNMIQIV
jgi:transitional endoplasmic reticulum ATPase